MKLKCNSPVRNPTGSPKKFKVLACSGGKKKTVQFGDSSMKIRKNVPAARKSFRARHKCDQKKNKLTAGWWSCKAW